HVGCHDAPPCGSAAGCPLILPTVRVLLMANAKDMIMRAVTGFHRAVFQASHGRLANRGSGMPVLQLTTTGRKSGKRRKTMLTSPVRDGDRMVVVASNGGDDRQPKWLLNLRDD